MQPSTVLAALAELAPAGGDRILDVTRGGQPLAWLADAERAPRKAEIDRLAALDALHREERILRRGWGFLAGRTEVAGSPRKVRAPLLSQPVRLDRTLGGYRIVPAGDIEISPLVENRELAARMEAAPGLATPGWLTATGTSAWLWTVGEATGLPLDALTTSHQKLPADRLVLVAQAALFVVRDVFGPALSESLRSWSGRDLSGTALSILYTDQDRRPETNDVPSPPARAQTKIAQRAPADARAEIDDPVLSPLPLTEAQARVVASARTAPLTVVSGPPGNGKSHAVIAAALDVVHRGGSVLVATQSPHAADVLAGLLARYPGPTPVLFGDAEKRAGLAASLAAGQEPGTAERDLRADRATSDQHLSSVRAITSRLAAAMTTEQQSANLSHWQPRLSELAADVPGAFPDGAQHPAADDADLRRVTALLARARETAGGGWWRRWRAAAAYRKGMALLRVREGVPDQRVTEAIEAATAQRAAAQLAATGGTDLAAHWGALHEAEADLAAAVGTAMNRAARSARRWTPAGRREAAALSTALRSGRTRRRELLAALDGPPLVKALPLWIGTVTDVEDLLPPVPGLFDLVVIDEASHVDQVRAAPVLARARTGIGVISPFRSQADALEAALLAAFPADRIEALRLRVGTVHAFQGSEADVVIASLGLAPGDTAARRRFVADPHLFNVLITRARERFVVVTSLDTADGLLGDYLAYAEKPPDPEPGPDATGWAASLTTELRRLGATVRPNYAVGSWQLDLVVGAGLGVLCGVHPDGPAAHIRRQRALHRAGWDLADAFPSRWHGDPRRAALEIAARA